MHPSWQQTLNRISETLTDFQNAHNNLISLYPSPPSTLPPPPEWQAHIATLSSSFTNLYASIWCDPVYSINTYYGLIFSYGYIDTNTTLEIGLAQQKYNSNNLLYTPLAQIAPTTITPTSLTNYQNFIQNAFQFITTFITGSVPPHPHLFCSSFPLYVDGRIIEVVTFPLPLSIPLPPSKPDKRNKYDKHY